MLLVQDGDMRGLGLLFVMEAAGAAQTRMGFAFALCLEHSCSFGNSPGAFSFGALEWKIKAGRPSLEPGRDSRSSPCPRREVSQAHPQPWMGHSRAVPTQASIPYCPLCLPCWPQHLELCAAPARSCAWLQARCGSRAASSAQQQIAVLFLEHTLAPCIPRDLT